MFFGQFIDKARGHRRLPAAVNLPVCCERNPAAFFGAGDAYIGKPPFLFERGVAVFIKRAFRRENLFLPAGQEDDGKLKALRCVQRHQPDLAVP